MIDDVLKSIENMSSGVFTKTGIPNSCSTVVNQYTPENLSQLETSKTTTQYNQIKMKNPKDKRISLNVAPLISSPEVLTDRINYVLGSSSLNVGDTTVYGFLRSCLTSSVGLIFPYTPTINIAHKVNYDSTAILHSNVSVSHYKNTPPPTISISSKFTADTRENAKHMLSAIWFLRACTKSDFGEVASKNLTAGLPPPVLYLNGYNKLMDDIPVIISDFSYSLQNDRDYVLLDINLDSPYQEFTNNLYSDASTGQFYDSLREIPQASGSSQIQYINGQPMRLNNTQQQSTVSINYNNDFLLSNWLPIEMDININLTIQPNVLKYKKEFDLDKYKMGIMFLDNQKSGSFIYEPTSDGLLQYSPSVISNSQQQYIQTQEKKASTQTTNSFKFGKSGWTW